MEVQPWQQPAGNIGALVILAQAPEVAVPHQERQAQGMTACWPSPLPTKLSFSSVFQSPGERLAIIPTSISRALYYSFFFLGGETVHKTNSCPSLSTEIVFICNSVGKPKPKSYLKNSRSCGERQLRGKLRQILNCILVCRGEWG